jgi:hypothetical protein
MDSHGASMSRKDAKLPEQGCEIKIQTLAEQPFLLENEDRTKWHVDTASGWWNT